MNTDNNISDEMTHFECVGQFHDTFGHLKKDELYEECFHKDPKLVPFRISLMREELDEFKDAYKNNDMIEMADALCDLSYVTNGAGHCLGINLDKLMKEHNTYSNKICNYDDESKNNLINDGIAELEKYLSEFAESADKNNLHNMGLNLVELLCATYDLGYKLKFDMDKMFREVHRSNMTKVCSNVNDANESIELYKKEGRYAEPSMKIKGEYYVIYDKKTSKILKNHKWETPNLKQFM